MLKQQMVETVRDTSVIFEGLGRCDRYNIIYRTLGVAGHKDFLSVLDYFVVLNYSEVVVESSVVSEEDDDSGHGLASRSQ